MNNHDDFDFEHSPGIPAPLPPGEHIVWQGSPDKWHLALDAFHLRKVVFYFALLLLVHYISGLNTPAGSSQGISFSTTVLLSSAVLAILFLLAWLSARVTIYTITNRRLLIRFGIALQITMNLPFTQIKGADMRVGKDGFGDIPLQLKDTRRVSYLVLWPHVRPWRFAEPQPMLRSIADVEHVAKIIGSVAAQSSELFEAQATAVNSHQQSSHDELSQGNLIKPEAL